MNQGSPKLGREVVARRITRLETELRREQLKNQEMFRILTDLVVQTADVGLAYCASCHFCISHDDEVCKHEGCELGQFLESQK